MNEECKSQEEELKARGKVFSYEKVEDHPYPPVRQSVPPEWKKKRSDGIRRQKNHRRGKSRR